MFELFNSCSYSGRFAATTLESSTRYAGYEKRIGPESKAEVSRTQKVRPSIGEETFSRDFAHF